MTKTKIRVKRLSCILGCAAKCKIEMDGICVGKVANGKTVEFWADKGLHTLSIYWGWKKKTTIEINVEEKDETINLIAKLNIAKDRLDFYSEDNQLLSKDLNKGSTGSTPNGKGGTNFARRDVVVLVSAAVVVCFCVVGILLASNSMNSENTDVVNTQNENMAEEKAVKQNDKVIKLIVKKCNILQEEAEQVKKDFESVGINELTGFTEFEGAGVEGMKSFKYTSKTVSGTLILTNDGTNYTTNYISSGDITLFDSSKGGVLDNISRYYLSDDEKSLYLYQSEELIKQCLRSPSSADFPNWYSGSWQIGRRDDVITIVSYVDAQNAFGAMIRSKFVLQFSHANQLCTYCQLDGEVISGTYKEVK